jgi:hypothetical protein
MSGRGDPETKTVGAVLVTPPDLTASLYERPTMSKILCLPNVPVKTNRKSYRPTTPFGYGILLPPAPPPAPLPPITPSQLAAQIAEDLVRIREIGRRQDALLASPIWL